MRQIIRIHIQMFCNVCNLDRIVKMPKNIIFDLSNQRIFIPARVRLLFFCNRGCIKPLGFTFERLHFYYIINFFYLLDKIICHGERFFHTDTGLYRRSGCQCDISNCHIFVMAQRIFCQSPDLSFIGLRDASIQRRDVSMPDCFLFPLFLFIRIV